MKWLFLIILVLLIPLSVSAQGAGDPLPVETLQPLATAGPIYATIIPYQLPTWTPMPPIPTSTPFAHYRAYVRANVLLYKVPARQLFIPIMLVHPGEILTVEEWDQYWLYIVDGWIQGNYIEKWATVPYCCD